MFADESAHLPISDVHRAALNWFETNRGAVRAWHEIAKQGDSGNRLASLAKGIYKPAYTEYALSIRQTLTSPYSDKEIVYRPDGSWLYPYFQENSEPSLRDKEATNRGLMKCLHDGVPIGVLIQTKPKPGVEYLVLGLGRVVEWTAGYFIIERYHQSVSIAPIENAARDWVSADLKPIPPSPQQNVREWEIRQVLCRRGQARFRASLMSAYAGQCAISDCNALDALEAAHIAPYSSTADNATSNGLLLRADLHSLFDLGLIGINPTDMKVIVSPKLATSTYGAFNGQKIKLPQNLNDRPSEAALNNHVMWAGLI